MTKVVWRYTELDDGTPPMAGTVELEAMPNMPVPRVGDRVATPMGFMRVMLVTWDYSHGLGLSPECVFVDLAERR